MEGHQCTDGGEIRQDVCPLPGIAFPLAGTRKLSVALGYRGNSGIWPMCRHRWQHLIVKADSFACAMSPPGNTSHANGVDCSVYARPVRTGSHVPFLAKVQGCRLKDGPTSLLLGRALPVSAEAPYPSGDSISGHLVRYALSGFIPSLPRARSPWLDTASCTRPGHSGGASSLPRAPSETLPDHPWAVPSGARPRPSPEP